MFRAKIVNLKFVSTVHNHNLVFDQIIIACIYLNPRIKHGMIFNFFYTFLQIAVRHIDRLLLAILELCFIHSDREGDLVLSSR